VLTVGAVLIANALGGTMGKKAKKEAKL